MKCHEVLNTSINAVQSGTKVQMFLRNLMSAYLGLSSCETLRFYKTTRSQIPIKLGPYRPGQVLRVANGGGSQNSRQSAYEGSNAVSPTHRPTVPPRDIPVTHFC